MPTNPHAPLHEDRIPAPTLSVNWRAGAQGGSAHLSPSSDLILVRTSACVVLHAQHYGVSASDRQGRQTRSSAPPPTPPRHCRHHHHPPLQTTARSAYLPDCLIDWVSAHRVGTTDGCGRRSPQRVTAWSSQGTGLTVSFTSPPLPIAPFSNAQQGQGGSR